VVAQELQGQRQLFVVDPLAAEEHVRAAVLCPQTAQEVGRLLLPAGDYPSRTWRTPVSRSACKTRSWAAYGVSV
jgi:mRNA-degrading endonuclease toxin of MazEF toxin-antitoxin module